MKAIIFTTYLLFSCSLFGQKSDCHTIVKGIVLDSFTNTPLELTNIEVVGVKGKSVSTDAKGFFTLEGLCNGPLELHISHQQCEHIHIRLILYKDTTLTIYLKHVEHQMEGYTAIVKNEKQEDLNKIENQMPANSISDLMKNIGGVTLLKTGSTISKPIVNGLHGNRVIILNNGIRQEGQNWGMEHAPEIDAFLATEIELLKGAEALRYASDGIGGVIMIKPPSIFNEKTGRLKGEVNAVGNTNGRGGVASVVLGSKISEKVPVFWRVQGTIKKSGNIKTPAYYLANTGVEEMNFSAALGYIFHHCRIEVFHSSFSNRIGIFKGSQIGNIQDLMRAFNSDTPLVHAGFTYNLDRPFQQVDHRLTKASMDWSLNAKNKVQWSVSYQQNHRQEYDRLRSAAAFQGPDFDYYINTWLGDVCFLRTDLHKVNFTAGINGTYQSNSYTGRFFIPGFYNKAMGAYFLADRTFNKLKLEAAVRYDAKKLTSYLWNANNLTIEKLSFQNATYFLQGAFQKNKKLRLTIGTSSAWRPPAPNELYSNGLHQGLATIEIGDAQLKPERSFNQILNIRYADKKWFFESEFYYKRINGFINLIPSLPPQLTIRGAFPVYKYVQQDVCLLGLNLLVRKEFGRDYFGRVNSNLMIGENLNAHIPLSQMSPLSGKLGLGKENKQFMVQFWYQATAKQFRYTEGTDYVPPPKGFALFGCDASVSFKIKKQTFKLILSANNILNTRYREYLNRFRYFADEQGFGLMARLMIPLNINYKK